MLYDCNALIQRLPLATTQYDTPMIVKDTVRTPHRMQHPPVYLAALLLSHLFFALAHWLLFIALIGVRRAVNPFGMGISTFRSTTGWREQVVTVEAEEVRGDPNPRTFEAGGDDDTLEHSSEELAYSDDQSESDDNDITDLQPSFMPAASSLRTRLSRASLGSAGSPTQNRYNTFRA